MPKKAAQSVAAPAAAEPVQESEPVKKIVFDKPVLTNIVEKNDDLEYDIGHLSSYDPNPLNTKLISYASPAAFL
jgi:hypothetical protein